MNDKIIDFAKIKGVRDNTASNICRTIDIKKCGPELNKLLDELWNDIYMGMELAEIYADDDWRIHYRTCWPSEGVMGQSLQKHLNFFVTFINKNCRHLVGELFSDYEKFLDTEGVKRMLYKEEKSPIPDQEN